MAAAAAAAAAAASGVDVDVVVAAVGRAEVGQIKSWMSNFRQNITSIEECYGQYVTSVTNEQTKEASDKLDELIDDTNELTHKIRGA